MVEGDTVVAPAPTPEAPAAPAASNTLPKSASNVEIATTNNKFWSQLWKKKNQSKLSAAAKAQMAAQAASKAAEEASQSAVLAGKAAEKAAKAAKAAAALDALALVKRNLLDKKNPYFEFEQNMVGDKIKTITVHFGDVVNPSTELETE